MEKTAFARYLRHHLTDAERKLWRILRHRQLRAYKFRRQFPLGAYIVDFVCLQKRLIIEVDGGQHSEQISYDKIRDNWLKSQGFKVLRFWNNEVLENLEGVNEVILRELNE